MKKVVLVFIIGLLAFSVSAFENHETENGTYIVEATGSACLEDFNNQRNKTIKVAQYQIKSECIESAKSFVSSSGMYIMGDNKEDLATKVNSISKGMVRIVETKEKYWNQEALGNTTKNCYNVAVICEIAPLTQGQ